MPRQLQHHPFAAYRRGIQLYERGRPDLSEPFLEAAYKRTPDGASFRHRLIRTYVSLLLERKQMKKAEHLLRRELDKPEGADRQPGAALMLARLLREKAYWWEALAILEPLETAEAYCEAGAVYLEIGESALAEKSFAEALRLAPDDPHALLGLADSLHVRHVPDMEIAARLLQVSDHAAAVAEALAEIGADGEALDLLAAAGPLPPALLVLRRRCLFRTGQYAEAMEEIRSYMNEGPEDVRHTLRMELCLCEAAAGTFGADRLPEGEPAETWIEAAVERHLPAVAAQWADKEPKLYPAYVKSLFRNGFLQLAGPGLARLAAEGRLDVEGRRMYAESLYEGGQYLPAAEAYEGLITQNPECHRLRVAAAVCYLDAALELLAASDQAAPSRKRLTDAERILNTKRHLLGIRWRTVWNGSQRRNRNVQAGYLPMYDRQE